ncbi:cytochrome P450 4V2-like isoform X3 [Dermacentor albipictus]
MYEGRTFKVYIGTSPTVVLHTPEAAEVLLSSKENTGKPNSYAFLKSWLGPKNLLTSKGDPWKAKAKLFKNAFNTEHLESCMAVFNDSGKILEKRIESITSESPDKPVVCYTNIQSCVLDIIGRALFGIHLGLQNGNRKEYARWFNYLTFLLTVRYFRPWLWIQALYDSTKEGKIWKSTVDNIGNLHLSVIERRKSAILRKLAEQSYNDELDDELSFPAAVDAAIRKHISGPSSYTLDELEKDATSVTFAAADSTSAAMSWTLYLLGLNPDKQAKLQKELDDALGRGIEADITTSDLKQLPYLECCIKESLRLCPPFPLIGRELDEELVIDGYTVPAGTTCMINIHSLHRNTEQFADPENYIPERFLPENCKNMHPFSFIPFSSGVRVCLGQKFVMVEAKVLLAKLLSKYTVESTQPLEEVKQAYEVVLKARGGLRVWFRKRGDPV